MFFIFSIVTKIELYEVFYGKTIFRGKIDTHALTGVVLKSKFKLRLPSIFLALHLYVFLYDTFLDTYRG
ncbi:MAG: hypothetical protein ACOYJW_01430, partial [Candidatus Omnitrophota bacterium]